MLLASLWLDLSDRVYTNGVATLEHSNTPECMRNYSVSQTSVSTKNDRQQYLCCLAVTSLKFLHDVLIVYLQNFPYRGFTFQVTNSDMPPVVGQPIRKQKINFQETRCMLFDLHQLKGHRVQNCIHKWWACCPWWRTWFHEFTSFSEAAFLLENMAQLQEGIRDEAYIK